MSSTSRPLVRKSSPSPLPRALDAGTAARPLTPVRRAAGSLAVAAAMILGVASASGCGDAKAKRDVDTRDESRSRKERADREERVDTPTEPSPGDVDPLHTFADALSDLVSPKADETKPATKPLPPIAPPTSPVITPDPTPPRPAGGISVHRPAPESAATAPKPSTIALSR